MQTIGQKLTPCAVWQFALNFEVFMKKMTGWMDRCSRMSFLLMLVVGVYLFYAIYKMYQGLGETAGSPLPIYLFMGLFAVVGILLMILGLFAMVSGHYKENSAAQSPNDPFEDDSEV